MGDLISKYPVFDLTKDEEWNGGGRPLKFTPEEFKQRVTQFFEYCENEKKPLTLSRLASFLNCDRKTLLSYSHKDQFLPTIKKLRSYIEAQRNEDLLQTKGNIIGHIFDLKNNHGWRDQQEMHVTNDLIPITIAEDKEVIDVTPEEKLIEDKKPEDPDKN